MLSPFTFQFYGFSVCPYPTENAGGHLIFLKHFWTFPFSWDSHQQNCDQNVALIMDRNKRIFYCESNQQSHKIVLNRTCNEAMHEPGYLRRVGRCKIIVSVTRMLGGSVTTSTTSQTKRWPRSCITGFSL